MKLVCINNKYSPKLKLFKEYYVWNYDEFNYIVEDPEDESFLAWEFKEYFGTLAEVRDEKINQLLNEAGLEM